MSTFCEWNMDFVWTLKRKNAHIHWDHYVLPLIEFTGKRSLQDFKVSVIWGCGWGCEWVSRWIHKINHIFQLPKAHRHGYRAEYKLNQRHRVTWWIGWAWMNTECNGVMTSLELTFRGIQIFSKKGGGRWRVFYVVFLCLHTKQTKATSLP